MASQFNPQYRLDLISIYNRAYKSVDRELRDKLRATLRRGEFKALYSSLVIDEIQKRTQDKRIDKSNKPLGTYKSSYQSSLDFKIYKGKQSTVNLTLTGDMLSSMTPKKMTGTEIVIEFIGDDNKNKAYGHISGFKGHPFIKGIQKRDFFGLPKDVEEKLMVEAIKNSRSATPQEIRELRGL